MKTIFTLGFILIKLSLLAQINLSKQTENIINVVRNDLKPSESEVKEGLSDALRIGSEYAVNIASQLNGFNSNKSIRITIPQEANKLKESLLNIGLQNQIYSFEESMNHAAESACKSALQILANAISQLTIKDAFTILNGKNNAATNYLHNQTNLKIYNSFKPIIKSSMQKYNVTKKWSQLATKYNSLPFTKQINPDLEDYITNKAIYGLFILMAEQEKKIRTDPLARTTKTLRKVFD